MSSKRSDGRAADELRPIEISFNELERADGSARFSFGSTSSLASFTGPMEVRLQKDQATRATLEVVHRPLEGIGATPSRAFESAISSILPPLLNLGQHPRSLVQLIVQSLSPTKLPSSSFPGVIANPTQRAWPSTLSAEGDNAGAKESPTTSISLASRASGINAVALSILSASALSLSAVPVAISLATVRGTLVLDPTMKEEADSTARFGFAWAIGGGEEGGMDVDDEGGDMELVWVESEGSFTKDELSKAGVRQVWASIRLAAGEHVDKTVR